MSEFSSIVLVGVRADGAKPIMTIASEVPQRSTEDLAAAFLGEHDSCETVELWRGEVRLATISRSDR